ncbi:S24 family peptidase [Halomonas sp. 111]
MVQNQVFRDEFASRLKKALSYRDVATHGAGVFLCRVTNKTPKAASKWLNAEAIPGAANMQAIASSLGVRREWLQYGVEPMVETPRNLEGGNFNIVEQPETYFRYPVVSWVKAGSWAEAVSPFTPGCEDRYLMTDYKAKGGAFWLEVNGDSMTASVGESVPQGMMILIDTGIEAENGSLVVAQIDDSEEATFKKLVIDGGQRYLKPLNPAYPVLRCDTASCRILGVAVEMKRSLR